MRGVFLGAFTLLLSCSWVSAQEHHDEHTNHEFKHHRLSIIIGHGHVFGATEVESGKDIITIPTWGFDYQYWFNNKFSLSLKTDVEIMDYVVNSGRQTELVRNSPVIISGVFIYNPHKGWNFFTGPGIEIEKEHNFFVLRAGCAYEFEVANHWDFAPEMIFDLKNGNIGAFTWGIGVGKKF